MISADGEASTAVNDTANLESDVEENSNINSVLPPAVLS